MEFVVVGLNHRSAPLQVREKLVIPRVQLAEALEAMGNHVDERVILCTCNRSEIYSLGLRQPVQQGIEEFLVSYFDISPVDVDRYLYSYHHDECIRHLFRVASSLDSMILGERQILGQVRDAFDAAKQANTVHDPLSRLFHQALRVGKRVRRETGISRNALSVSRACVELARHLLGDLRQLKAMVVGTGDAGKLAVIALKDSGVSKLVVTNRTYERAVELASELEGEAIAFQDMPRALMDVDIVISSTGSPGYILEAGTLGEAMSERADRPLFLIDIAIPRDIDPAVARVGNVFLYNLDNLESISKANRLEREQEARGAEEIVTQEVGQFLEWFRTLEVLPTITALRERAEEIRHRELTKLLRRLDHKLTQQDIESLEAMTRAIVNKLLHDPTTYLKKQLDPSDIRLAEDLFNLDHQAPPVAERISESRGEGLLDEESQI